MLYTVSNCSRRKSGVKREEEQYPTAAQLLPSLPPSTQPIYYALSHILHHSVTYALHPFSQHQCHLSLLIHSPRFIQPLSGHHNSTHVIQGTCPSLSNSPQTTRKLATCSLTLLSYITHLSSQAILLFLSSSYPAEPVVSLNSNLTLSCPCPYLTYLSDVLYLCTSSSQLFSMIAFILFFNLPALFCYPCMHDL